MKFWTAIFTSLVVSQMVGQGAIANGGSIGSFMVSSRPELAAASLMLRSTNLGNQEVDLIKLALPKLGKKESFCDSFFTQGDRSRQQECQQATLGGPLGEILHDREMNTVILTIKPQAAGARTPQLRVNGVVVEATQKLVPVSLLFDNKTLVHLTYQFAGGKFATAITDMSLLITDSFDAVHLEISRRQGDGEAVQVKPISKVYYDLKNKKGTKLRTKYVDLLPLLKEKVDMNEDLFLQSVKVNSDKKLFVRTAAVLLNGRIAGMPKELPWLGDSRKVRFPIVFRDDSKLSDVKSFGLYIDDKTDINEIEIELAASPRLLDSKIIDWHGDEYIFSGKVFMESIGDIVGERMSFDRIKNLSLLVDREPKAAFFINGYGLALYKQTEAGVCFGMTESFINVERDCQLHDFWGGTRNFIDATDFARKEQLDDAYIMSKGGNISVKRIWIELE